MKLFPDQEEGKKLLIESIKKGHKRIGFAAPCSYGKTVLMSNLTQGALNKNKRVWIIVDSTELIDQTRETLMSHGIESAVIQGYHEDTDYSKEVQVVTAQTITRRWVRFDQNPDWLPDLVLVDEFHIQYKAHKELMNMLPNTHIIGFSATPVTKGLGQQYTDLVVGSTVRQLLADDRLSPIRGFACYTPNMKGVKTSQGDYAVGESEKRMNTKQLRGDILSNWKRLGENRKTIVFCVNVAHSIAVAETFQRDGIIAAQIDGKTPKDARKKIIDSFRDGQIQILVSVGVIIKGFNVVDVGCIIDAQPTKSMSRHIQKIGRGMRKNDVYKDCLVLDNAGNLLRNGFPEEFEPTELCDGEKGEVKDRKDPKEKLPTSCGVCGAIKPVGTHKCPVCGFEPTPQSEVETEEGDLQEVKRKLTPAEKRNKEHNAVEKQEFYSCALAYCKERGKKQGYAANVYRDYYGVWPNKREKVTANYVSQKVRNFINAKNIRWAKRKNKA